MNAKTLMKSLRTTAKRKSPEILTGIGIAGMITASVMAVRATPKAILLINEKEVELGAEKLTKKETVKATWKCYVPAVITGAMSIACIVGANSVNARRNAALTTAYALSETALREYRDKVVEVVGEKKEQAVRDAIAKDRIEKNPVSKSEVIITGNGSTLFYDPFTAGYFESDLEVLRKAVNDVVFQMLNEGSASLNDFYYNIGRPDTKPGYDLGWNANNGTFELRCSAQIADNGRPCLALDFTIPPSYNYDL